MKKEQTAFLCVRGFPTIVLLQLFFWNGWEVGGQFMF